MMFHAIFFTLLSLFCLALCVFVPFTAVATFPIGVVFGLIGVTASACELYQRWSFNQRLKRNHD